jgi:8-oxo-dGTP pyrophosphatase MutT (NUDIX family)
MSYWKRLETTTLFEHPRLTVVEDKVLLPDGAQTAYLRFEKDHDFATVIARSEGKLAFVREYSYPLDQFLLQFPEGSMEPDEAALDCAQRELSEEAGLASDTYTEIGTSPSHHRRIDAWQHVLVADEAYAVPKTAGDIEEQGIETVWIPETGVNDLIASGEIVQRNTLAAWAIYNATLQR